jgi:hypothetical protein
MDELFSSMMADLLERMLPKIIEEIQNESMHVAGEKLNSLAEPFLQKPWAHATLGCVLLVVYMIGLCRIWADRRKGRHGNKAAASPIKTALPGAKSTAARHPALMIRMFL